MSNETNTDLAAIASDMCAALEKHSADDLWAAAQKYAEPACTIEKDGKAEYPSLTQRFANGEELKKAIVDRDAAPRAAAIALLHHLGDASAPAFYERILGVDLKAATNASVEGLTRRARDKVSDALAAKLSADQQARLWLDAKLDQKHVGAEAMAKTPLSDVAAAALKHHYLSYSVGDLLAKHPGFARDDEAIAFATTFLEQSKRMRSEGMDAMRIAGALVKRKSAAVLPLLATSLADADARVQREAARLLLELDTPESLAKLASAFDLVKDPNDPRIGPAVLASLRSDPAGAYERFHRVVVETSPSPMHRAIFFAINSAPITLFASEPRWLDQLVRGLAAGVESARFTLAKLDRKELQAALAKHGWKKPERTKSEHPIPKKPKWVERYKAGEHDKVWSEIVALEDSVHDAAIAAEVKAVAGEMMARVKKNLEQIVAALTKKKYPFAKKTAKPKYAGDSSKKAITPPGAKTAKALAEIEKISEGPLPIALRAFYEIVGSVDLTADPEAELDDDAVALAALGRLDPILVVPPEVALKMLQEEAQAMKTRFPPELQEPVTTLYLGGDPDFKADPKASGDDRPYRVDIFAGRAGAPLLTPDRRPIDFVAYLREVVLAGGFRGLAGSTDEATARPRALLTKDLTPF